MGFLSTLFGSDDRPTAVETPLEMVTTSASLSSSQTAIDPLLDKVRSITAATQPGQPLSPQDELTLLGVYMAIEYYLTNEEPVRAFTKEGLRKRFSAQLVKKLEAYEAEHKVKTSVVQ